MAQERETGTWSMNFHDNGTWVRMRVSPPIWRAARDGSHCAQGRAVYLGEVRLGGGRERDVAIRGRNELDLHRQRACSPYMGDLKVNRLGRLLALVISHVRRC
jgi:hypothetical protein